MRRPNICGSSASIVDDTYKPAASRQTKEVGGGSGRVSLMRRILGGGSSSASKKKDQVQQAQFGVAPIDLPLVRTSLFPTPKPLYRMCSYLQRYGVDSGSSLFKGMSGGEGLERLKSEWNNAGDVRIEDCTSPALVASLLRIWLNELPEPFITKSNTQHLIRVNRKYQGEDSSEWSRAIADALSSCSHEVVLGSLDAVLSLLHRYTQAYPLTMAYIPGVFTPLLAHVDDNSSRQETLDFVSKLILNYNSIFTHMGVDTKEVEEEDRNSLKEAALVISEIAHTARQRKRKERHDSLGQSNNNEPKFVRSNSEERGVVKSCVEDMKADSMRRVSSHEDFSKSRSQGGTENQQHSDSISLQDADIIKPQKNSSQVTPPSQVRKLVQPLHERNARSPDHHHCLMFSHVGEAVPMKVGSPTYTSQNYIAPTQVYAPVGADYTSDLYDENEHEMRRISERFAPAHTVRNRRHRRPKHRTPQRSNPKENGVNRDRKDGQNSVKGDSEEIDCRHSTSESLLDQDFMKKNQEEVYNGESKIIDERGTGSSEVSGNEDDCSSSDDVLDGGQAQGDFLLLVQSESFLMREDSLPLDDSLPLLDVDGDSTTPVTSSSEQSLKLDENQDEGEEKCLSPIMGFSSPMLDMKARGEELISSEPISSTPLWASLPPPSDERLVSPRNSMVVSRRLYTAGPNPPSDQCITILDINAQIHSLKQKLKKYEEGFEREFGFKPSHSDKMANSDIRKMLSLISKLRKQARYKKEEARIANLEKSNSPAPVITEDTVKEIERRLSDKRTTGGRGDSLETMSLEQLIEEKAAMQKALLQLEATYGRPSSKKDRDVVRPLYERYRQLKRSLLKQTPSKMKESVSELGTILEHEAMDFSSGGNLPPSPPPSPPPEEEEEEAGCTTPRKTIAQTVVLDNLHSLPHEELVLLQRTTREEKKRLKRSLRQAELEIGARGVGRRADRPPPADPKLYTDYKHTKAKLKFIDALINKFK